MVAKETGANAYTSPLMAAIEALTEARTVRLDGYRPGLDGVRAIAVIAVLLFHAGYGWMGGGFLGVSVFFTLSGFLISSLVLDEHARSGRLDLKAFWIRRARRLLPASLLTIAVVVLGVWLWQPSAKSSLGGDVLGALGYVANWRFFADGQSYTALFAAPSPLLHFWSLAIEEQFYVVFPLLAMLALRRAAWWPRLFGGLWIVSFASALLVSGNTSLGYYATFARAPELLTGVLLAWLVRRKPAIVDRVRLLDLAGLSGLGVLVVAMIVAERTTEVLSRGGFAALSFASGALVLAASQAGLVARLLGWRPLISIGKVSYGLYLFHWPISLWLTPSRVGFGGVGLQLVRWAVTGLVAAASYHFVEQPIRHGQLRKGRSFLPAVSLAASAAVGALVISSTVPTVAAAPDYESLARDLADDIQTTTSAPIIPVTEVSSSVPASGASTTLATASVTTAATIPATPPTGPPRVGLFGDSTILVIGDSLRRGGAVQTGSAAWIGCTVFREGIIDFLVERRPIADACRWERRWPQFLFENPIDVALLGYGGWDASDRVLPSGPTHLGEPAYDALVKQDMLGAVDLLLATGKPVVLLNTPSVAFGRTEGREDRSINDPIRVQRFNEIIAAVAAERPAVRVLDFAGYLESLPGGQLDAGRRPDGVHLTPEAADEVARWLAPQLVTIAREQRA